MALPSRNFPSLVEKAVSAEKWGMGSRSTAVSDEDSRMSIVERGALWSQAARKDSIRMGGAEGERFCAGSEESLALAWPLWTNLGVSMPTPTPRIPLCSEDQVI